MHISLCVSGCPLLTTTHTSSVAHFSLRGTLLTLPPCPGSHFCRILFDTRFLQTCYSTWSRRALSGRVGAPLAARKCQVGCSQHPHMHPWVSPGFLQPSQRPLMWEGAHCSHSHPAMSRNCPPSRTRSTGARRLGLEATARRWAAVFWFSLDLRFCSTFDLCLWDLFLAP